MEGTVTYNLGCPCEVNCLDGCDECDNPVCDCQVSVVTKPKLSVEGQYDI